MTKTVWRLPGARAQCPHSGRRRQCDRDSLRCRGGVFERLTRIHETRMHLLKWLDPHDFVGLVMRAMGNEAFGGVLSSCRTAACGQKKIASDFVSAGELQPPC